MSVRVVNKDNLYYDTETGIISNKIKYGCNRNAIIDIPKNTLWVLIRNKGNYTLVSGKGYNLPLTDKNGDWFKCINK